MDQIIETTFYSISFLLILIVVTIYILKQKRESKKVDLKIAKAKEYGIHEPVSLYPVIDPNRCINSGACITACHEKDIFGI